MEEKINVNNKEEKTTKKHGKDDIEVKNLRRDEKIRKKKLVKSFNNTPSSLSRETLISDDKMVDKTSENDLNEVKNEKNGLNEKKRKKQQKTTKNGENDSKNDSINEENLIYMKKILIFTTAGCPYCKSAKNLCTINQLPFEMINLDFFTEIRENLMEISNMRTFPQIFIGEKCIGGKTDFEEYLKKNEIIFIQSLIEKSYFKIDQEIYKIYLKYYEEKENFQENFDEISGEELTEKYKELIEEMMDKKEGISVKDRLHYLKNYRKCFVGRQAIDWLSSRKKISREEGVELGNKLIEKHLIEHVHRNQPFKDDFSFYRFLSDDDALSSSLNFKEVSMKEPKEAAEISMKLRKVMLAIYDDFLSDDGKKFDYIGVKNSFLFRKYEEISCELQRLNLFSLNSEEKCAFFINIYNALIIHGFLRRGVPKSFFKRVNFFTTTSYVIGGNNYSLDDIEHGILRGNRRHPMAFSLPFSSNDPRRQFTILEFDSRIHFALVCGAKGCPPIKVYSPSVLSSHLSQAARAFLEGSLINLAEKEIHLNMILKWYKSDFVYDFNTNYLSFYSSFPNQNNNKNNNKNNNNHNNNHNNNNNNNNNNNENDKNNNKNNNNNNNNNNEKNNNEIKNKDKYNDEDNQNEDCDQILIIENKSSEEQIKNIKKKKSNNKNNKNKNKNNENNNKDDIIKINPLNKKYDQYLLNDKNGNVRLLLFLMNFLSLEKVKDLSDLIESGDYKIVFMPYDWALNSSD